MVTSDGAQGPGEAWKIPSPGLHGVGRTSRGWVGGSLPVSESRWTMVPRISCKRGQGRRLQFSIFNAGFSRKKRRLHPCCLHKEWLKVDALIDVELSPDLQVVQDYFRLAFGSGCIKCPETFPGIIISHQTFISDQQMWQSQDETLQDNVSEKCSVEEMSRAMYSTNTKCRTQAS